MYVFKVEFLNFNTMLYFSEKVAVDISCVRQKIHQNTHKYFVHVKKIDEMELLKDSSSKK